MPRDYTLQRADADLPEMSEQETQEFMRVYSNAPTTIVGRLGAIRENGDTAEFEVLIVPEEQVRPEVEPTVAQRFARMVQEEDITLAAAWEPDHYNMPRYYRLDGKTPVPCTFDEHLVYNSANRIIMRDDLSMVDGLGTVNVVVSTVFLCIDHRLAIESDPVLFETMIFGGEHHDFQRRYCTFDQAVEGHVETLQMVRLSL